MQFSTTLRNARGAQIGATLGQAGTLAIYAGPPPGVAAAEAGAPLATLTGVTVVTAGGVTTLIATADPAAAGSGTPGHGRLRTSAGVPHAEGTAGVGAQAVAGAPTLAAGALADAPVVAGGAGYDDALPPGVLVAGDGRGAILRATVVGGVVTGLVVVAPGIGYTDAAVTILPPFDFTFAADVTAGGTVSLAAAAIFEGNP